MKKVSPLPSMLTLCNFICGFISVIFCIQSLWKSESPEISQTYMLNACYILFLAMVFDMLDGRVARLTGSASKFGGELDSLADCVSFGVAPAVIVCAEWIRVQPDTAKWWSFAMIAGIVYASCAVLRLARYNVEMDTTKKDYFVGLPSPGAAGCVAATMLLFKEKAVTDLVDSVIGYVMELLNSISIVTDAEVPQVRVKVLGAYLMVIGLLMVSRMRFMHVANKMLGGRTRFTYLVVAIFLAAFLFIYPREFFFCTFNVYVLMSIFGNLRRALGKKKPVTGSFPPVGAADTILSSTVDRKIVVEGEVDVTPAGEENSAAPDNDSPATDSGTTPESSENKPE